MVYIKAAAVKKLVVGSELLDERCVSWQNWTSMQKRSLLRNRFHSSSKTNFRTSFSKIDYVHHNADVIPVNNLYISSELIYIID